MCLLFVILLLTSFVILNSCFHIYIVCSNGIPTIKKLKLVQAFFVFFLKKLFFKRNVKRNEDKKKIKSFFWLLLLPLKIKNLIIYFQKKKIKNRLE